MYAHELYEQNKPRVVVTYPGRFQPFHQGHAGVFAQLQKKFGRDSVYILTSNDTSSAKSPFNFSDKYQLMTAAGVPGDKIIETNQMYKLPDSIDAANTIFITAVGAPDADRLNPDTYTKRDQKDKEGNITKPAGSPSYYKTWGGPETPVTSDQHGYVIIIPEIHKEVTIKGKKYDVSHGTECRNLWNAIRNDAKARTEFLTQMYARPSQELAAIFDKIPQTTSEDVGADSQTSTSPIHGVELKQGVAEDAAGVGVVAKNKKMAKDPRYSMSITKDVKPSTPKNMLRAFRLSEDSAVSEEQIISMVKSFLPMAVKELKLKKLPKIIIKKHIESHDGQATFGRFANEEERIYLGIADRHPVDILRTLAHELVHSKQHEQGRMEPDSGDTGSPIENEANAVAGVLMRYFNKKYPNAVKSSAVSLDESLFQRYQQFKENGDEADEIKKQKNLIPYPKGTVKVDVSDVYDWYKLGQEISDLDDADPADFGKGPPQTVMAFGSEPEEHRYLKDLKRLGLKTHDIDENFADGRNPQDKGDSKRYNVPTKGKISTLRKIAKQGGRRGQLAHWAANMRSGKNKK
jgi:hypothetical protein